MNQINLLHIVENLKPGGIQTVLLGIAKEIDKTRYNMMVWSLCGAGGVEEELKEYGVDVRIFEMFDYKNLKHIFLLKREIRKYKVYILHAHQGYITSNMARTAGWLARVPVVIVHIHRRHIEFRERHISKNKLLHFITGKIICNSNYVKEFVFEKEHPSSHKIVTIYNGIIAEKYTGEFNRSRIRKEFNIENNTPLIGTLSIMSQGKGHKYLIESVPYVLKEFPNVKFLIVGDGMEMKNLKELTIKLGIKENIIFSGFRTDVADMLSAMDIFVFPSTHLEGFGNALIEAMAMGLPVIATDACAFPEIVENNKSGMLVPPRDEMAIAEAIISLLKNSQKMQNMSQSAKLRFEQFFTAKIMTGKIENLYKNLCRKNSFLN